MRPTILLSLALAVLVTTAAMVPTLEAYVAKEEIAAQVLVQREAPGFEATAYQEGEFKDISLEDFRGKWAILFFYPQAFSYVCPTEVKKLSEQYNAIKDLGADVLALSVDSHFTIKAWHESDPRLEDVTFPIISDSSHEIGILYGVMNKASTNHLRATFIIDPEGIVQYQDVYNEQVGRSISELLRTLQALQTGAFCPVEWQPGEATIAIPPGRPYR